MSMRTSPLINNQASAISSYRAARECSRVDNDIFGKTGEAMSGIKSLLKNPIGGTTEFKLEEIKELSATIFKQYMAALSLVRQGNPRRANWTPASENLKELQKIHAQIYIEGLSKSKDLYDQATGEKPVAEGSDDLLKRLEQAATATNVLPLYQEYFENFAQQVREIREEENRELLASLREKPVSRQPELNSVLEVFRKLRDEEFPTATTEQELPAGLRQSPVSPQLQFDEIVDLYRKLNLR